MWFAIMPYIPFQFVYTIPVPVGYCYKTHFTEYIKHDVYAWKIDSMKPIDAYMRR